MIAAGQRLTLMLHDVTAADGHADDSGFPGAGAGLYKIDEDVLVEMADAPGAHEVEWTFDDGGASAVDVIAPVLTDRGLVGTFFVATSRIGTPGFVDRAGLRRLAELGHRIGSHSHTHPDRLPALGRARILEEWRRSVGVLEDVLGTTVDSASVPNGFADSAVLDAGAEAGLRHVYTSVPTLRRHHHGPVRVIGRFAVLATHDPSRLRALVSGAAAPRWRQQARWHGLTVPKTVLGPAYPRLHSAFFDARAALSGRAR